MREDYSQVRKRSGKWLEKRERKMFQTHNATSGQRLHRVSKIGKKGQREGRSIDAGVVEVTMVPTSRKRSENGNHLAHHRKASEYRLFKKEGASGVIHLESKTKTHWKGMQWSGGRKVENSCPQTSANDLDGEPKQTYNEKDRRKGMPILENLGKGPRS